jgi:hypothetical protein
LRSWTQQRRRRGGAEEVDWGLGLMQGKQSSTMPSPAAPAPILRWRLDHGWLWLGCRRPWLGLLRLRSGHARHPPSSGGLACRPDGDLVVQRHDGFGLPQCGFWFSSLPLLHSFPLPLPLWIAAQHEGKPQGASRQGRRRILGRNPQRRRCTGRGRRGGIYRATP